MKTLEKEILNTLSYFRQFDYYPTLEELHTYVRVKSQRSKVKSTVEGMVKRGKVKEIKGKYTQGGYSIRVKSLEQREKIKYKLAQKKIESAKIYIKLLEYFPQIQLIGVSGSLAMMSAKKDDDIDLFIITSAGRLWTGRAIALVLASLLGVRRKRGVKKAANQICLNLLFDAKNLKVPKRKQNIYVAHEVLQMKPIVSKNGYYLKYLDANRWVFDIFPNARNNSELDKKILHSKKHLNPIGNILEKILKGIQLCFIERHRTSEIITTTQLWFFPDDFEKKILL